MKEPLKTSLLWTVLITAAIVFTVAAVTTKGFGLWNVLVPERPGIVTGFYDKQEKLEGILFFSSFIPDSDTVRVQRLVLGGRGNKLETYVGASIQNFGFHKLNDLLMQTEWVGRSEEKHKVVLREEGEVVEEIFFPDQYIAESALSPQGDILALVMSQTKVDFSNKKAASDAQVYLYDVPSKTLAKIGSGVSPRWDPTGNYVTFVTNEGVMVHDRAQAETNLDLALYGLELSYGMSDVSNNGKSLAIVDGIAKAIKIYKILEWDNFTVDVEVARTETMPGAIYSPLFSPRDRYLTFLATPAGVEGVASTTKAWTYDQAKTKTTYLPLERDANLVPFMIDEWIVLESQ